MVDEFSVPLQVKNGVFLVLDQGLLLVSYVWTADLSFFSRGS